MWIMKQFFLTFFMLISIDAFCESAYDIEVGANYFLKGFTSDDKVKVIEVNRSAGRVKIYNPKTEEVDWVNASSLITRSESRERDLNKLKTVVDLVDWALKPSSTGNSSPAHLASEGNNTGGFKITNECSQTVRIAIRYVDFSDSWRTEGWWTFNAGESNYLSDSVTILKTKKVKWYYYAEGVNDKSFVWKGNNIFKLNGVDIPMVELTDTDGDNNLVLTCKTTSNSANNNTGGFKVTNECNQPVRVAIHYKDVTDNWRTEGWWTFNAGEPGYLTDPSNVRLITRKVTWYYYAEGVNDKSLVWKGNNIFKLNGADIPMVELKDDGGDSDWVLTCK